MKRITFLRHLLIAATAIGLASCSSTGSTASGVKPYTSDKCIVTGNKLGSMGTPVTKVYQGQEVKFCCQPCATKFEANPEKYLAKLN